MPNSTYNIQNEAIAICYCKRCRIEFTIHESEYLKCPKCKITALYKLPKAGFFIDGSQHITRQ